MNEKIRRVVAAYQFKPTPVIIDPYDKIVQQAYNKLPTQMQRNIDVIKLETTCPGNKAAWVSNKDLLTGSPGKERVIHLCLQKIKDQFKKQYGSPFTMMDHSRHKEMEDIVVAYLRDVILPHEETHIRQEIKGEGDFGLNPELEAERSEDYKSLEQYGIRKKSYNLRSFTMRTVLSSKIDEIASKLEAKGLIKEATQLDVVSNTLEMMAAVEQAKVDDALKMVMQADPSEIQMALKQFAGARVAFEEKEAINLKQLAMALGILSAAMGASGAEGWNPNDPNSKIPGVEQEQQKAAELKAKRLKLRADQLAENEGDSQKMQAILNMLAQQGKKPGDVVYLENNNQPTKPAKPADKPQGKYESPSRQRAVGELDRLEPWTTPQLGGQA